MKSSILIVAIFSALTVPLAQTSSSPTPVQTPQAGAAATPSQQPQAKNNKEYAAYKLAASENDPAQSELAADKFAQNFPDSELKGLLYSRVMQMYQMQNNSSKVVATGRKAIALNPTDPVSLVAVASALVIDIRENDLDRDSRYAEAAKDAQAALDNMDTGLQVSPSVRAEEIAAAKANWRSVSYDVLGVVAMNKKDYAGAEQNFQKAADLMKEQPDAAVYLRLSVSQDKQGKYQQGLDSANKAAQYAPEGSTEKNLAKQEQARLQKLIAEKNPSAILSPTTPPH